MRGAEVGVPPKGPHLAAAFLASDTSSTGRGESAWGVGRGAAALPGGAAGEPAVVVPLLGPLSRFMRR